MQEMGELRARGPRFRSPCVVTLLVFACAAVGCTADRGKPAGEEPSGKVDGKLRKEIKRLVELEVARRLPDELAKVEARLLARLANRKKVPVPPPEEPPSSRRASPAARVEVPAAGIAPRPAENEQIARGPDEQGFKINRVVLAKTLVGRRPEGEGTSFTVADGRVYCYVDANNAKGPDRIISVVFKRGARVFSRAKLRVGKGRSWRTWAYLTLRSGLVGGWSCSVYNDQQKLLGAVEFQVAP